MIWSNNGGLARYVLLAFFLLCAMSTSAETLTPKYLAYEVEVKHDNVAKSCHLVLLLNNIPAPEIVNLKLFAARKRRDNVIFFGLSLDVGELTFVNGLPSKTNMVLLSKASFDSPSFSSAGRLNGGPIEDGGVLLSTAEPETGRQLVASFLRGLFSISFVRKGSVSSRTYVISQAPPVDDQNQFRGCLTALQ